jgi:hypothetical protein
MTIGDDQPLPGTSIAQATLDVRDHVEGTVASGALPVMPGPRNPGHSAGKAGGSATAAITAAAINLKNISKG